MPLTKRERQIFEVAFKLGFNISFDGWNGSSFRDFNRRLEESDIFINTMQKEIERYEFEHSERSKAFASYAPLGD